MSRVLLDSVEILGSRASREQQVIKSTALVSFAFIAVIIKGNDSPIGSEPIPVSWQSARR